MNLAGSHLNLVFAWVWILAGFLSGMVLGLRFHDDNWLGGYGSFKRRMHRLAHISFFGLGAVNLFFHLTVKGEAMGAAGSWASMWPRWPCPAMISGAAASLMAPARRTVSWKVDSAPNSGIVAKLATLWIFARRR